VVVVPVLVILAAPPPTAYLVALAAAAGLEVARLRPAELQLLAREVMAGRTVLGSKRHTEVLVVAGKVKPVVLVMVARAAMEPRHLFLGRL
jgi:hypothetical protein